MELRFLREMITGLVVVIFASIGLFWLVPQNTKTIASGVYDLSPDLMPNISLGFCLVLGLGLMVQGWRNSRTDEGGKEPGGKPFSRSIDGKASFDLLLWVVSSILIMLILPLTGFIVSGILILAGWLVLAGERSIVRIALISLIMPVLLERVCWYALTIQLP